MESREFTKRFFRAALLTSSLLFLTGCDISDRLIALINTPAATPAPPTATPAPPTATPVPPTATATPTSTVTATRASTPTALPPTATATLVASNPLSTLLVIKNTHPIRHAHIGTPPSGLPDNVRSEYLRSTGGGFSVREMGASGVQIKYYLVVLLQASLPAGAAIDVQFENPTDADDAVGLDELVHAANGSTFWSEPVTGMKCRNYWIDVHIYNDMNKSVELGRHLQWVKSGLNYENYKPGDTFSMFKC